ELIGRGVYPEGGVGVFDLATQGDLPRHLTPWLLRGNQTTIILENLDAAKPHTIQILNHLHETGELRDPTATDPPLLMTACLLAYTSTDSKLPERLGAAFPALERFARFQAPTPPDLFQVVGQLMTQECSRHGIQLDYVDETVLAELAAAFENTQGYRGLTAKIRDRLQPEIVIALEHQHTTLSILQE
ncbi:MAG: hypothetical protein ACRCZF_12575, partial [Gemmataceae bacterium]